MVRDKGHGLGHLNFSITVKQALPESCREGCQTSIRNVSNQICHIDLHYGKESIEQVVRRLLQIKGDQPGQSTIVP